jgi:hypothetical protein
MCVFTACQQHSHEFTERIITNEYLATEATCKAGATYYYACKCGEKGDETFKDGEVADHFYVYGDCKWCDNRLNSEGLEFTLINNSTEYEVSGIGTCLDVDIVFPTEYLGLPVTAIGDAAFSAELNIKSISVSDSITRIDNYAFRFCYSLERVSLGENVESLGEYTFSNCTALKEILIPNSLIRVGTYTFFNCPSLEYNVKNGYKYLGNEENRYAYLAEIENKDITTVEVDENCKFIGEAVFANCTELTTLILPEGVRSISSKAFQSCSALEKVSLPSTLTSIGVLAFERCGVLKEIIIPSNVKYMEKDVFNLCNILKVYCEASHEPIDWHFRWNPSNRPVLWYSENEPTTQESLWHYVDGVATPW